MIIEIKIPIIDKDVEEYHVLRWLKENGSIVKKDEYLVEIETDEDTYLIPCDEEGILEIVAKEGSFVKHDDVLYNIKTNEP